MESSLKINKFEPRRLFRTSEFERKHLFSDFERGW